MCLVTALAAMPSVAEGVVVLCTIVSASDSVAAASAGAAPATMELLVRMVLAALQVPTKELTTRSTMSVYHNMAVAVGASLPSSAST